MAAAPDRRIESESEPGPLSSPGAESHFCSALSRTKNPGMSPRNVAMRQLVALMLLLFVAQASGKTVPGSDARFAGTACARPA